MNLVNELQVSAERDEVLTVLRRAKRLASKLDVPTINDWMRCELDGYGRNDTLPPYRIVKATITAVYHTPTRIGLDWVGTGPLPLHQFPDVDQHITWPMSHVVSTLERCHEPGRQLRMSLGDEEEKYLRRTLPPALTFSAELTTNVNIVQVMAIPEIVKNKVLDWALELERKGVLGEHQSFSPTEKQAAHTIIFNIDNSTIEQLNNLGSNNRG